MQVASKTVTFCKYTQLQVVAKGGNCTVYRARDPGGRIVAIKRLNRESLTNPAARATLELEALKYPLHANIVAIYDVGICEAEPFMAMQFIDGESLEQRIKRSPLTPTELLPILYDVSGALEAAHSRRIVHRDVKPGNILIRTADHRAFVTDFGVATARATEPRSALNVKGIGTPLYMPPEQINGLSLIDARSDVYSLGCTVFHALSGQPPFMAESDLTILHKHLSQAVPDLSAMNPLIPKAVTHVVARAMAKDPAQRWPTTAAFVEAFEQALNRPAIVVHPRWIPASLIAASLAALAVAGLVLLPVLSRPPSVETVSSGDSSPASMQASTVSVPTLIPTRRPGVIATPLPAEPTETRTPAPSATQRSVDQVAATATLIANSPTPGVTPSSGTVIPGASSTISSGLQLSVPANTGGYEAWHSPLPQTPCADGDDTRPATFRFKVSVSLANTKTSSLGWQATFTDRNGNLLVACASSQRAIDPLSAALVEFITYSDTQSVASLAVMAGGKTERICFSGQFVSRCN